MSEGFTAHESGLDEKKNLDRDKKAATTKAPAPPVQARTPSPTYPGWTRLGSHPGITYYQHEGIARKNLRPEVPKAISYLNHQKATTGRWLLSEIERRSKAKDEGLQVAVHFYAEISDYPKQSEVNPVEQGHATMVSGPVTLPRLFYVFVFVARKATTEKLVPYGEGLLLAPPAADTLVVDRPECLAATLFHELLHVWFVATNHYNERLGTGHDPGAAISIDSSCNKIYTGFDPDFQKRLDEFDHQLATIPGAARCCS